jgi:hypothetical protein
MHKKLRKMIENENERSEVVNLLGSYSGAYNERFAQLKKTKAQINILRRRLLGR